jgi:hypothetical protein
MSLADEFAPTSRARVLRRPEPGDLHEAFPLCARSSSADGLVQKAGYPLSAESRSDLPVPLPHPSSLSHFTDVSCVVSMTFHI